MATHDHSWTAYGVDVEALIDEVALVDEWCALQPELCYRFAMQPKEARHLRPHMAIVPREAANPRDAAAFPECETFLRTFAEWIGKPGMVQAPIHCVGAESKHAHRKQMGKQAGCPVPSHRPSSAGTAATR